MTHSQPTCETPNKSLRYHSNPCPPLLLALSELGLAPLERPLRALGLQPAPFAPLHTINCTLFLCFP